MNPDGTNRQLFNRVAGRSLMFVLAQKRNRNHPQIFRKRVIRIFLKIVRFLHFYEIQQIRLTFVPKQQRKILRSQFNRTQIQPIEYFGVFAKNKQKQHLRKGKV